MKKRILGGLLSIMMLLPMTAGIKAQAAEPAANVDVTISASQSNVEAGGTVDYTITIGAVEKLADMEIYLSLPEGLSLVSMNLIDEANINAKLGGDQLSLVLASAEERKVSLGGYDYTSAEPLQIAAFTCKAADGFTGEAVIGIDMDQSFADATYELDYAEYGLRVTPASVTVDPPHVHSMEEIAAVASTCLVQGSNAYFHCTACGRYFKDAEGAEETTPEAEAAALAAHTLSVHTAVAATAESTGNIDYWECSVCGKLFSDADGANEITQEQTITPVVSTTVSVEEASSEAEAPEPASTEAASSEPAAPEPASTEAAGSAPAASEAAGTGKGNPKTADAGMMIWVSILMAGAAVSGMAFDLKRRNTK